MRQGTAQLAWLAALCRCSVLIHRRISGVALHGVRMGKGSAARMQRVGMMRRQARGMPFARGRGSGSTIECETLTARPGAMIGVAMRGDVARPFHIRNVSLRSRHCHVGACPIRENPHLSRIHDEGSSRSSSHNTSRSYGHPSTIKDGILVENARRPGLCRITCETIRLLRARNCRPHPARRPDTARLV
ncbi:hypothetical protein [Burkholderia sp. lig30]|jgi:hypothetical protein|uniref:hypothetical protein n=1 Tax=Burkholderia sp. lig30 TaxID=1192124 RepID=UPI00128F3765|nr:hypothetical protein [Burkholderia sp. lig30]